MKKMLLMLGCVGVLLSGCMTLKDEKSLLVKPNFNPVVVKSEAVVKCYDYFFFHKCELFLNIRKEDISASH